MGNLQNKEANKETNKETGTSTETKANIIETNIPADYNLEVSITCDVSKFDVKSIAPYCKIYNCLSPGTITVPCGQIVYYVMTKQEYVETLKSLPGVISVLNSYSARLPYS